MKETIEAAKAEFTRAKDRLAKNLATTPDDRINWSPSDTSRTPIHQVAHAAMSLDGIKNWLAGNPFPFKDMAELDSYSRAKEKEFSTRESVNQLLEDNSNAYLSWLDAMTPEHFNSNLETSMGTFPMSNAITFAADHLRNHAGQIEYMQTIYGDHDWYM